MTLKYLLDKGAADDLRSILRYTRDTWGSDQARAYVEKLRDGVARLGEGHGVYKTMAEIHPGLRVARCEHHYIFCLWREDAPIAIIAILHERMDLIARIKERLR